MTTHDYRKWRIGWRPLDKARAEPKYMPEHYETFNDAAAVAASLNHEYPESHFFVDLVPEVRETMDEEQR